MTIEERYNKLRAAVINMVGVADDLGLLIAMVGELHRAAPAGDEDALATMRVLVALIETHPSKP